MQMRNFKSSLTDTYTQENKLYNQSYNPYIDCKSHNTPDNKAPCTEHTNVPSKVCLTQYQYDNLCDNWDMSLLLCRVSTCRPGICRWVWLAQSCGVGSRCSSRFTVFEIYKQIHLVPNRYPTGFLLSIMFMYSRLVGHCGPFWWI
jgi:hypothetical protein